MLTQRFDQALLRTAELHRQQTRKGSSIPYLSHLLAVAALVLEHGGDEETAIAALLHDAVEDQGGPATLAEIRRTFGDRVARIVDACTDTDQTPKPPWKQRKLDYIQRLAHHDADVRLVVAADKLHNARTILSDHARQGVQIWAIFSVPPEQVRWYYRAVAEALCAVDPRPVMSELRRTVELLEQLD
jgi:(p)ppGpp synthase/HD superfamily hydrolase